VCKRIVLIAITALFSHGHVRHHLFFVMNSLKIAIVGSGPSAFYTASHLLKLSSSISISIFERLPIPFGLVRYQTSFKISIKRYGVAPDHQDVKNVTHKFNNLLADPRVSFIGNLELTKGGVLTRSVLDKKFHATVLACGASDYDNLMDIPGSRACSAREFVNWYNGVPGSKIDCNLLAAKRVSVIGLGNVAIDCARILLKEHCDLKATDIPEHVLRELKKNQIRNVDIIGRRGPMEVCLRC
jgi:NADPH-dependent glutamate synthase beta subunit-like oxidoreductase